MKELMRLLMLMRRISEIGRPLALAATTEYFVFYIVYIAPPPGKTGVFFLIVCR